MKGFVIAITGPAGSGKTTVAAKLANQLEQCVNIEVDQVKHMVVNGFVYDQSPEGIRQWELLGENLGVLTRNFHESGYRVIINGYLNEPAWKNIFKHIQLTDKFLLIPDLATLKKRDKQRPEEWILGEETVGIHHDYFSNTEFYGDFIRLDTTQQTAEQTVEVIKHSLGFTATG